MPDNTHKQQILDSAPILADVMLKHLGHNEEGMYD
jgi:hypothetical protein